MKHMFVRFGSARLQGKLSIVYIDDSIELTLLLDVLAEDPLHPVHPVDGQLPVVRRVRYRRIVDARKPDGFVGRFERINRMSQAAQSRYRSVVSVAKDWAKLVDRLALDKEHKFLKN